MVIRTPAGLSNGGKAQSMLLIPDLDDTMISFEVNDMSCGHCVGAITRAIQTIDSNAKVAIDLATHRVQIESGSADAAACDAAIREAGFTPVAV
jgi:copper chaperone